MGWALFYFVDSARLFAYCSLLFGATEAPAMSPDLLPVIKQHLFWLVMAVLLCMPIYPWLKKRMMETSDGQPRNLPALGLVVVLANLFLLLLTATTMLVGKTYNPFLYFRF